MNRQGNISCMTACMIRGLAQRERKAPLASEMQHNENALDWNASLIIAESEFPARKIFSWWIRVVEERNGNEKKGKKGTHGLETGFPRLGAADLRTLAKARQNRMWKIEFTKQLSIELIYNLHREVARGTTGGREGGGRGTMAVHLEKRGWMCVYDDVSRGNVFLFPQRSFLQRFISWIYIFWRWACPQCCHRVGTGCESLCVLWSWCVLLSNRDCGASVMCLQRAGEKYLFACECK